MYVRQNITIMKNFFLFILTFILLSAESFAQGVHTVSGSVINSSEEPLAGAMITCISLPDSTVSFYAISGENGRFQIKMPSENFNKAYLEVTYLGYEKQYIKTVSGEMKICLKESPNYLGDVTVKAKSTMEKKAGKLIFSPLNSDFNKGLDSYEILRYTPLITMQGNAITMLGRKRVTIYINGRLPSMSQTAVQEMLRSMPADRIKHIEIITAPNSSYKASMTGGVLNIILKNNPDEGFTGRVNAGLAYRSEKVSPDGSLYLGYSKNKFRSSASLWILNTNSVQKTESKYDYKKSEIGIRNLSTENNSYISSGGNINFEYDINKKNNIGASFTLSAVNYRNDGTIMSEYDTGGILDYLIRTDTKTTSAKIKPDLGATIYYNLKTDSKGSNLDISASYNRSYSNTVNRMEYSKTLPGNDYQYYEMFRQNPVLDINTYVAKADYSHYFKDESYLKVGIETNATHINNEFLQQNWNGQEYVNDKIQCNRFIYDEFVNALYINYERQWNDIFSSTLGLRGEHTLINGDQRTQNEKFKRHYFNLFPQLSLNFDFADGNHSLSLDLGKSIFRPLYTNLNPFRIWTSPSTYTAGNKDLESCLDYIADITYILLDDYVFGTSYCYTDNSFSEYIGQGMADNTTVTSIYNFGHEQELSFFAEIQKNFFNGIWRPKLSLNCYYNVANGKINMENIGFRSWEGSLNFSNIIKLSKKRQWDLIVDYNYYTPSKSISRIRGNRHLLFINVMKRFEFGGVLKFAVNNILNYRIDTQYGTDTYFYRINSLTNGVSFTISYSQTFGNSKVRGAKNSTSTKINSRMK